MGYSGRYVLAESMVEDFWAKSLGTFFFHNVHILISSLREVGDEESGAFILFYSSGG